MRATLRRGTAIRSRSILLTRPIPRVSPGCLGTTVEQLPIRHMACEPRWRTISTPCSRRTASRALRGEALPRHEYMYNLFYDQPSSPFYTQDRGLLAPLDETSRSRTWCASGQHLRAVRSLPVHISGLASRHIMSGTRQRWRSRGTLQPPVSPRRQCSRALVDRYAEHERNRQRASSGRDGLPISRSKERSRALISRS